MLTYGSYYSDEQNIPVNAARVVGADLAVSILAGIAIFPAVFSFGFEPAAGTQLAIHYHPIGVCINAYWVVFFMFLFFLLTAFAAIGAMISLIEVVVAFSVQEYGNWTSKESDNCHCGLYGAGGVISCVIEQFFG